MGQHADETRTVSSTGGEKGVKDARFDLIPVPALTDVAKLYGQGAKKYAENNWRRGYEWSKSYASAQRHLTQFWDGEDIDEEMGLPHLAGTIFHCLALMTFMQEQPGFDDRWSTIQKRLQEGSDPLEGFNFNPSVIKIDDPDVPATMFGATGPVENTERRKDQLH